MNKERYEETERLPPSTRRVFDHIVDEATAFGTFSGSQATVAKRLGMHHQTAKEAFGLLIRKRYIAKQANNIYMLNPERFYRGTEEHYAKAFHMFYDLASEDRNRRGLRAVAKLSKSIGPLPCSMLAVSSDQ